MSTGDNDPRRAIRRLNIAGFSALLILFGGIHPTIAPDSVINHRAVDIICLGEGEYPVLDLCEALESGENITDIANIWVKKNGMIHKNPIRDYPQDLDNLSLDREGISYMGIFSGRGCYGSCSFCNTPTVRKIRGKSGYFRKRSVANVLDEVEEILSSVKESYDLGQIKKLAKKLPDKFSNYGVRAIEKLALILNNRSWIICLLFVSRMTLFLLIKNGSLNLHVNSGKNFRT